MNLQISEITITTETGTLMNSDHTRAYIVFTRNGKPHTAHAVRYHGSYLGKPHGVQTDWKVTTVSRQQYSRRSGSKVWVRLPRSAALVNLEADLVSHIVSKERA